MKETKIMPIGKFLLLEKEIEKPSDIVLPDNAGDNAKKIKMRVIAVGDECTKVKVGDIIITAVQNALGKFSFDGEDHFMTNEEAVACVVRA